MDDDVAKRREARRRRILENSQNRLNRISGVEQKRAYIENHFEEYSERSHEPRHESLVEQSQPQPQLSQNAPLKPHLRKVTISALAVFISFILLLVERFELDSASHQINRIFIPFFLYELMSFFTSDIKPERNFLFLLAQNTNKNLLVMMDYLQIIASLFQDLLIYFFVFVCCEIVKSGLS